MEFEDRIIEILIKETTGQLSAEEGTLLSDFSAKSAANSAFIAENRVILGNFPAFEEESISMFDVDSALSKVKSKIDEPTAKIRSLNPNKTVASTFNLTKWAAAIVLLVGFGTIAYTFIGISSACEKYAAVDQIENILLSDGSQIILNKNSTLELAKHYGDSETRSMTLTGEAHFKVTPNADKPFIVHTGDIEVEVLGTQFNIDAREGKLSTTVFVDKGKVKVTSLKSRTKLLLTAGESSTFDRSTFALYKDKVQRHNATSWIDNKLRFEDAALFQVLQEIEDHFDINVELKNSDLSNCPYTSVLNANDADEVLETLSAVFNLQLMKEGDNTFELTGGNGNCN